MIKIVVCRGCPASGKSFWSQLEIAKDPLNSIRINNDLLRNMFNGSEYSADYEKIVSSTRAFLIREAIKHAKKLIIVDNVNANKRHWEEVCKIAKESNKDITVEEKLFFEPLEVLLERDSKREGKAQVGEKVVRKFFKELGGDGFKHCSPKQEIFTKNTSIKDRYVEPMKQDENLQCGIMCDLDGSLAKIGNRSVYDSSNCDLVDSPNDYVVETVKLHYQAGYKIIFCSGRMEKDRAPTMRFINNCLPNMEYELFMRKDNDFRKDSIIKEEIFNNYIKPKYFIKLVLDDRLQVCKMWYELGLNLLRIGDPCADF